MFLNDYISKLEDISKINKLMKDPSEILFKDNSCAVKKGYDDYPVTNITWFGANEFCLHFGLRLPSEAEWEFAAKGGRKTKHYRYSGSNNLAQVAWYKENAIGSNPIGLKKPNELGIYDMTGNINEWCNDWFYYYKTDSNKNGGGPLDAKHKVFRGGGWKFYGNELNTSGRRKGHPLSSNNNVGFRVALSVK